MLCIDGDISGLNMKDQKEAALAIDVYGLPLVSNSSSRFPSHYNPLLVITLF